MSKSSTTTNPDWLELVHAGDILLSEFIEPLELTEAKVAEAVHVEPARISAMISGISPVDADLDLRLTRYFRLSEGYFLRIQTRHDTLAAKRALNGELERILPLAA
ncbi:HigA family addiction module antitoxin [Sphingorhabdus sp.]|jgi:addiction module HigA family antidote|uniref:HigA family addiction module antitoxin n=1 Tax=Sphingorhabdus sp. TaxID=1902408 RepID=UPI003BAEBD52|nr:HigA family addiction module antidote protein [Sphingomonadales bacterium]MBK9431325.1 HigA family addiction module antidote protein [Sphingomonadales bacterium]MBL0022770.1 HigA family addiction module antidote protein [Sphingomonadales bacterium]